MSLNKLQRNKEASDLHRAPIIVKMVKSMLLYDYHVAGMGRQRLHTEVGLENLP